jgi:hypothetical protein
MNFHMNRLSPKSVQCLSSSEKSKVSIDIALFRDKINDFKVSIIASTERMSYCIILWRIFLKIGKKAIFQIKVALVTYLW